MKKVHLACALLELQGFIIPYLHWLWDIGITFVSESCWLKMFQTNPISIIDNPIDDHIIKYKKNMENYGIFEMWCHTEELDRDAAAW